MVVFNVFYSRKVFIHVRQNFYFVHILCQPKIGLKNLNSKVCNISHPVFPTTVTNSSVYRRESFVKRIIIVLYGLLKVVMAFSSNSG